MKTSEAIFTVLPIDGKLNLSNQDDISKYLLENDGIPQSMYLKPLAKQTEKERMYAFIFGPLMACAVDGLTSAGYHGIDKVKARYILEAELCKAESYSPSTGKTKVFTESISGMNNPRLLKFAVDACLFLEVELKQTVPDSEQWKMRLKSGKNFDRVK